MDTKKFRNSCRGGSSATNYIIILILVVGVAGSSIYVINNVDSALEKPTAANAEFEASQDYDNINITYEGSIPITEGNTDVIEITNGSESVYITPNEWNKTAGTSVESGELVVKDITANKFQRGEIVDIIHFSEARKTNSGKLKTDGSGTRIETLTLEERPPQPLGEEDPEYNKTPVGGHSPIGFNFTAG